MAKAKDKFNRQWIIEKGVPIVKSYNGNLTLRALHYRLVAAGMHNTVRHYKRVIAAMTVARWEGLVQFDDFQDHDREELGKTESKRTTIEGKVYSSVWAIKYYLRTYEKNRWENQPIYPEVFIEKKALQGVFQAPCEYYDIALCPCKGYPSLTYQFDAAKRFKDAVARGKKPVILYFGDYDPSGEDIPRSIKQTLSDMGVNVEVKRIALMKHQVIERGLPPAPAKAGDSRTVNWDGLGQVELDSILPEELVVMVEDAIDSVFDKKLFKELKDIEAAEKPIYVQLLKDELKTIDENEE